MAYLVRRLLENTANDSFLRAHARAPTTTLLEAPRRDHRSPTSRCSSCAARRPRAPRGARRARRPAPAGRPDADRRARERRRVRLRRPGQPDELVAHAHAATAEHVDEAITRAARASERGRRAAPPSAPPRSTAPPHPARPPARARGAGRARCGKPWPEADADVCEAIDFLEYYAAGAQALDGPAAPADAGRAQRDALRPARRHRRDRALELPAGDRRRHGLRRARDRQRRRPEARRAGARVREGHRRRVARRRRPARRARRSCPAATSPGALVADPRIHTIVFTGSCAAGLQILSARPRSWAPAPRQARDRRDGRQELVIVDADADLDDVVPALLKRLRLRRPEVLRRLPRARPRRSPTSWPSAWRAR